MSAKVTISAGATFGRLTVMHESGVDNAGQVLWACRCKCGAIVVVRSYKLRSGHTTSCGCYSRDRQREEHRRHGHRKPLSREYRSWANAKQRCNDPNATSFRNYGGRGIRMCDEWARDFVSFLRDMGPCPEGHEIDRIDPDGNYEPGNCRWAPSAVQSSNRRNNRYVEVLADGEWELLTFTQAATKYGVSPDLLKLRLRRGWPFTMALLAAPSTGGAAHE